MIRVSTLLRVVLLILITTTLVYRGMEYLFPSPMMRSFADMPLGTRIQRFMNWGSRHIRDPRCLRVTVHVFEAHSTGILPLSLPPLEAAAVSRYGDRVFDIIRETAQYYDRLVALYPAVQFELLTAEEGMMVFRDSWPGISSQPDREGLIFHAREYTVRVSPASLDESNWLTTQMTVERMGKFLLGSRVTSQEIGTPIVIGGPVEGQPRDGSQKAVFVCVTASFVSMEEMEQVRVKNKVFESHGFDRPPQLIKLAEARTPESLDDELEGMSIFLTHIDEDGRVTEIKLVSSLRPDYDKSALDAIMHSQFAPAFKAQQPVDSWMFVPVLFQSSRRMPGVSASRAESD